MTWSYSGNPASSDNDAVRFLIGDTDTNTQLVTNEEIAFALDQESDNIYRASAFVARSISAEFATKANKSVGDLSIDYKSRSDAYMVVANKLEQRASTRAAATPYAGGISISDKDSVSSDTDRVQPRFYRGQFTDREISSDHDFTQYWDNSSES